jgi:Mg2+ and Co2+ transporter CorA
MFEPYQEIAQLEKNLVEINRLVSQQTARIERLADKGGDTTKAKAVLRGLEEVLEYIRAQQRMILDTLERE